MLNPKLQGKNVGSDMSQTHNIYIFPNGDGRFTWWQSNWPKNQVELLEEADRNELLSLAKEMNLIVNQEKPQHL